MILLTYLLAANREMTTWPEVVGWVGIAVCAVAAYYVWARWGQ